MRILHTTGFEAVPTNLCWLVPALSQYAGEAVAMIFMCCCTQVPGQQACVTG